MFLWHSPPCYWLPWIVSRTGMLLLSLYSEQVAHACYPSCIFIVLANISVLGSCTVIFHQLFCRCCCCAARRFLHLMVDLSISTATSIGLNIPCRGFDLLLFDTFGPTQLFRHYIGHCSNAIQCCVAIQKGQTCASTQDIFNGTGIFTTRIFDFGLQIWMIVQQEFVLINQV